MGKMNKTILILLLLMLSGCSHYIERSAKYSEFKLNGNYKRSEIIEILGEPERTEKNITDKRGENILDTYIVKGRIFDCGDYWATSAGWFMTLGLHELILFPIATLEVISQSLKPTEKELVIQYFNNNYVCQTVKHP